MATIIPSCVYAWTRLDGTIFKIAEQIYNPDPPHGRPNHCFLVKEIGPEPPQYLPEINLGNKIIVPTFQDQIEDRNYLFLPTDYENYKDFNELYELNMNHVRKFVDLDDYELHMAVVFIFSSWIYDTYMYCTYLNVVGDFNTGKSRYVYTVGLASMRPFILNSGSSIPAIRRSLHAIRGTMVLDEFDVEGGEFDTEVARFINGGSGKLGGVVILCDNVGKGHREKSFTIYGPKAFAHRKNFLDDATSSRCIDIESKKTKNASYGEQSDNDIIVSAAGIRNKMLKWRLKTILGRKIDYYPKMKTPALDARTSKLLKPMLSLMENSDFASYIPMLVDTLKERKDAQAKARSESLEAHVLRIIREGGSKFFPQNNKVMSRLNMRDIVNRLIADGITNVMAAGRSAHKTNISHVVTKVLGLQISEPYKRRGNHIIWDEKKLDEKCKAFSVNIWQSPTDKDFTEYYENHSKSNNTVVIE